MSRMPFVALLLAAGACSAPPAPAPPFPGGEIIDLTHSLTRNRSSGRPPKPFMLEKVSAGMTAGGYHYAANTSSRRSTAARTSTRRSTLRRGPDGRPDPTGPPDRAPAVVVDGRSRRQPRLPGRRAPISSAPGKRYGRIAGDRSS